MLYKNRSKSTKKTARSGIWWHLGWFVIFSSILLGAFAVSHTIKEASVKSDSNNYLEIKEWNFRFLKPDTVTDLSYTLGSSQCGQVGKSGKLIPFDCVGMNSKILESKGLLKSIGLEDRDGMGSIYRIPLGLNDFPYEQYGALPGARKSIGKFIYIYDASHSTHAFFLSEYRDKLQTAIEQTSEITNNQ
jgi:hypothetical protein